MVMVELSPTTALCYNCCTEGAPVPEIMNSNSIFKIIECASERIKTDKTNNEAVMQ
jgi:hypothetical protein